MFESVTTLLAQAFARVIQGIWNTVSTHAPGQPGVTSHVQSRAYGIPAATPLLRRIQAHIAHLVHRLDSLARRHESGQLTPPRPRIPRPKTAPQDRVGPLPLPLPRGKAWLIRHVQRTAQFAGQVEAFLARPDTRDLAAAAPQAGRILRPLCHMLGLAPPPWLRLPGAPPPPDPCPRREQRHYRRLNPIPWLTPEHAPPPSQPPDPAPPPKPWRMAYD